MEPSKRREFGPGKLSVTRAGRLFSGLPRKLEVWNSHGDKVTKLPRGFVAIGTTENSQAAAVAAVRPGATTAPLGTPAANVNMPLRQSATSATRCTRAETSKSRTS